MDIPDFLEVSLAPGGWAHALDLCPGYVFFAQYACGCSDVRTDDDSPRRSRFPARFCGEHGMQESKRIAALAGAIVWDENGEGYRLVPAPAAEGQQVVAQVEKRGTLSFTSPPSPGLLPPT